MSAPPTPPAVDVTALRPGYRVKIRDWRDGRFYAGTVLAHVAAGGARTAVFPPNIPARRVLDFRLAIFRDQFTDERIFAHSDLVEMLPIPRAEDRARWMVRVLEAAARQCPGCQTFLVDARQDGAHPSPTCPGRSLVPEFVEIVGGAGASTPGYR